MSKIKKADLLQLIEEQAEMMVELSGMVKMNKLSIIKLENESEQPKLKTLDQSVFDGLDENWRFGAVDEDGEAFVYMSKPEIDEYGICFIDGDVSECKRIGAGYDATNWQNSLIERESKELTGSDLCHEMLKRGDKAVMCKINESNSMTIIVGCKESKLGGWVFHSHRHSNHYIVTPINNQGEPLTAAEVGL